MKRLYIIFTFIFVIFNLSLSGERGLVGSLTDTQIENAKQFNLGPKRENPNREWTIIVYMAGDNNLEKFALKDMNEMEKAVGEGIDVIVLIDRAKGFDSSNGDWTNARIYRVKKDSNLEKISSELLSDLGEIDMGDKKTLKGFLSSAIKTFPAKHYALIMWNHGGGWAFNSEDRDISNQVMGMDFLTLDELSEAISQALRENSISKLDIIGFDMCLMSQIEIANQIKDLAKVMIASQANEPGDGWPYSEILPEFTKGTKGARGLATAIVEKYNLFYSQKREPIYTLSALDLSLIDSAVDSFNKIVLKLSKSIESKWSILSKNLFFSETYQSRIEDLRRGKNAVASIDMMDVLKNIVKSKDLKGLNLHSDYNSFVEIMDRFILSSATSKAKSRSNGVSIYAPAIQGLYNPNYQNLLFSNSSSWNSFLKNLYNTQQQYATTPKILNIESFDFNVNSPKPIPPTLQPLNTNGFKYKVDGKGILWIKGMYGFKANDGGLDVLKVGTLLNVGGALEKKQKKTKNKLEMSIPDYKDGLNIGNLYFDGLLYVVVGGEKFNYATVLSPIDSKYFIVPVRYKSKKNGEYNGNIYFDNQIWGAKYLEIYIPQKDGKIASQIIKPAPDDEITLRVLHIAPDGKDSDIKGNSFKWGDGPELALSYFTEGDYRVGLSVISLNGSSKNSFFDFKVTKNTILENAIKSLKSYQYKNSDFVGDWVFIDPNEFFKSGKIVKLNKKMRLLTDKQASQFLLCGISKDNFKNFDELYYVLIDFRIFPHFRYFKMKKYKKNSDIDNFKIVFTMPFMIQNQMIILQMDTLTYNMSMAIKVNNLKQPQQPTQNSTSQNQSSSNSNQPQYSQHSQSNSIFGVWVARDGEILKLYKEGRYEIFKNGKLFGVGYYQINGDSLAFQTSNKKLFTLKFYLYNNQLILEDRDGQKFIYERVDSSGAVVNSPQNSSSHTDLNGVWQMPGVSLLVISGNSYKLYAKDILTDKGTFQTQGDNLISKSQITGQTYRYKYRLNDNRFELIDMQGNRYVYFRN